MGATVPPASEDSAEERGAPRAPVRPAGPGDVDVAVGAGRRKRREVGSARSREAVGEGSGGPDGGQIEAAAPVHAAARGDERAQAGAGDRGCAVELASGAQAPPQPAPARARAREREAV